MKKVYKLFSLLVLLAMVFLALSCSEKAEMPYIPENADLMVMSRNGDITEYRYFDFYIIDQKSYAVYKGDDFENTDLSDFVLVNPHLTHFLIEMKKWVDEDLIEFFQPEVSKAFSNKLSVPIKMIEIGKYHAAYKKGYNDIYKCINEWMVNYEDKLIYIHGLELTAWMIENPDYDLNVVQSIINEWCCTWCSRYFRKEYAKVLETAEDDIAVKQEMDTAINWCCERCHED